MFLVRIKTGKASQYRYTPEKTPAVRAGVRTHYVVEHGKSFAVVKLVVRSSRACRKECRRDVVLYRAVIESFAREQEAESLARELTGGAAVLSDDDDIFHERRPCGYAPGKLGVYAK